MGGCHIIFSNKFVFPSGAPKELRNRNHDYHQVVGTIYPPSSSFHLLDVELRTSFCTTVVSSRQCGENRSWYQAGAATFSCGVSFQCDEYHISASAFSAFKIARGTKLARRILSTVRGPSLMLVKYHVSAVKIARGTYRVSAAPFSTGPQFNAVKKSLVTTLSY